MESQDFLQTASTVVLKNDVSFMKVILHPGECADGMWIIRDKDSNPFVLAVDCKSRQIGRSISTKSSSSESGAAMNDLPGRGSRALHFLNMAKDATAWPVKDVQAGSMLDALREGRFLYVYVSTQAESTFGVGDHILHMGRADSERFLSFFKSYYMLHRSSSSSAEAEAARDEKMRQASLITNEEEEANKQTDE
jgi:hypothetical protein